MSAVSGNPKNDLEMLLMRAKGDSANGSAASQSARDAKEAGEKNVEQETEKARDAMKGMSGGSGSSFEGVMQAIGDVLKTVMPLLSGA